MAGVCVIRSPSRSYPFPTGGGQILHVLDPGEIAWLPAENVADAYDFSSALNIEKSADDGKALQRFLATMLDFPLTEKAFITDGQQPKVDDAALLAFRQTLYPLDPKQHLLRDSSVWLSGQRLDALAARMIFPPAERVPALFTDWQLFLQRQELPLIIQRYLAFAQFMAIHPFANGNRRTGQWLVHAWMKTRAPDIVALGLAALDHTFGRTQLAAIGEAWLGGNALPLLQYAKVVQSKLAQMGVHYSSLTADDLNAEPVLSAAAQRLFKVLAKVSLTQRTSSGLRESLNLSQRVLDSAKQELIDGRFCDAQWQLLPAIERTPSALKDMWQKLMVA
jgi:Fic/DOC family